MFISKPSSVRLSSPLFRGVFCLAILGLMVVLVGCGASTGSGTTSAVVGTPGNDQTGKSPSSVVKGDFNNDGKLDIAVSNSESNNVSILLGNGDGTFSAGATVATGTYPTGMATGDFNGDGKVDLAVINQGGVSIFLGNGDGTFVAVGLLAGVSNPAFLAVGDFNGDGKLDMAVLCPNDLVIMLGNGDGTFTASPVSPTTGPNPFNVAVGDFNGDGKLDIAVSIQGDFSGKTVAIQGVSILLGNGDGTFKTLDLIPTTVGAIDFITAGDLNGDGKLDLVVSGWNNDQLAILIGKGDGTFTVGTSVSAPHPEASVIGDFNGDGKMDIAVIDGNAVGGVTILVGKGNGTFSPAASVPAPGDAAGIVTGNFNGDNKADLAIADSDGVAIALGK
jgi:hypothetical protein